MRNALSKGTTKLKSFIQPMLAKVTDAKPFNDPNWIFEIKWDGYRAIAEIQKDEIRFYSRNGLSYKNVYPKIYEELKKIKPQTVLDGEVVALDEHGKPSFQHLQNYSSHQKSKILYYVFDCLMYQGKDITSLPLLERKKIVQQILPESSVIRYCDHVREKGEEMYRHIEKAGLEGMIAKRASSKYLMGKRTTDWLKLRNVKSEEAIIVGFTDPKGSRKGFGSLMLAEHQDEQLVYIGNVGTGFNDQTLQTIYRKLQAIVRKGSPLDIPIKKTPDMTWVDPVYVCQIKYTERTGEGHVRHPVFLGLRIDKEPEEVKQDRPVPSKKSSGKNGNNHDEKIITVDGHRLTVRNLNKVYWPEEGVTKAELMQYYESVSKYILPHLKDRPLTLYRSPGGIAEEGFYHKNAGDLAPDFVTTAKISSESRGEDRHQIICSNKASLVFLNNLGCIEMNPWLSRVQHLDNPDFLVIDLDPSDKNTFDEVVEAAQCVYEILKKAGAKAYCKTSGSSGLHIYMPLQAEYDYEPARSFAHIVAILTSQQLKETTTLVRSKEKRNVKKIYVDYLQNKRGATLASVYSVRPVTWAGVSMPLHWKEVKKGLHPSQFNIRNALKRIEKEGDLFAPVLKDKNDIQKCLKKLGV